MKIALYFGEMIEHAEWLKHEAQSRKINITLLSSPSQQTGEYNACMFMAYSYEEVVNEFVEMAEDLYKEAIPFIWAVDEHPVEGAFEQFTNFDEHGDIQGFLDAIFRLSELDSIPVIKIKKNLIGSIYKKYRGIKEEKKDNKQFNEEVELPELEEKNDEDNNEKEQLADFSVFDEGVEVPENRELLAKNETASTLEPIKDEHNNQFLIDDEFSELDVLPSSLESIEEEIESNNGSQENTSFLSDFEENVLEQDEVSKNELEEEMSFSIFSEDDSDFSSENSEDYEFEPDEVISVKSLPNVIAVAGVGNGVGASFVALNYAYALDGALVEGTKTGSLYEWVGVEKSVDRESFIFSDTSDRYALIASDELKKDIEFKNLKRIAKNYPIVIDCSIDSKVFELAEHKIVVTTPDPQFSKIDIPDNAILIVNKMPANFPVKIDNLFERKVDLVIPDMFREVLISLVSKTPYLKLFGKESMDKWLKVLNKSNRIKGVN